MPKRPRSHILEEESRRALRQLIPSAWVVRRVESDYGIDEQVEIFEENEATGLEFRVQIRATDKPDLKKALAMRFRREQLAYFSCFEAPVLLVLYHAPSQRLFTKWFHRVDLNPRRKHGTIRLEVSDELTKEKVAALVAEVLTVRRFRSVNPEWPIIFDVSTEDLNVYGHSAPEFALAFGAAAGKFYIRFRASQHPTSPPMVHVSTQRTVVHLALSSTTIHTRGGFSSLDLLAVDVVCGIALALGNVGYVDAATTLARGVAPRTALIEDPVMLYQLAGFFRQAHRLPEALSLAKELIELGRASEAEVFASLVVLANHHTLSESDQLAFEHFLQDRIQLASTSGPIAEARPTYSLGNWLFHERCNYTSALSAYQRALLLDPAYKDREYFCTELAAALFENSQYEEAYEWYRRAIELGANLDIIARQGDVLMYAGRYAEALTYFTEYRSRVPQPETLWELKELALRWVIDVTGITLQERNAEKAERLTQQLESTEGKERKRLLDEALSVDALCGQAWFIIGKTLVIKQDYNNAVLPLLQASLMANDPVVWVDTFIIVALSDSTVLLPKVVAVAYRRYGSAFMEVVATTMKSYSAELRAEILYTVQKVIDAIPEDPSFTLRFLAKDGSLEAIKFKFR